MGRFRLSTQKVLTDYGIAIAIAVALAMLLRTHLWEAYRIPTEVMRPTLLPGDFIMVSKAPFGVDLWGLALKKPRLPHRGEVVTYSMPIEGEGHFIKRVVAFEGEEIEIREGNLWINGKELEFKAGASVDCGTETNQDVTYEICKQPPQVPAMESIKIPNGNVFMLSDLRTQTGGKPPWAIVPIQNIRGKASSIWFSIDRDHPNRGMFSLPPVRTDRIFRRVQ